MRVVDDLAADEHRPAETLQRTLDDFDRPFDAGAERPWAGEQHIVRTAGAGPAFERRTDAEKGSERAHGLALTAIGDHPHRRHRVIRQLTRDPRRLGIPGDGPVRRESCRLLDRELARRRHQRAGPHVQAQTPQILRHERRRRKRARWRPVRRPQFGAYHQGPGRERRIEAVGHSGQRHRRAGGQRVPHAGAGQERLLHAGAADHDAAADGVGLDPVRRQHGEVNHGPTRGRNDRAPSRGRRGDRGGS